ILVGIFFGNTILGNYFPELYNFFYSDSKPVHTLLGFQELGLIFLMFISGTELIWLSKKEDFKVSIIISVIGLVIPSALSLLVINFFELRSLTGEFGSENTIQLIFIIAVSVTSIPVISKIILDLNLLGTRFSRIVLTVALIEDLFLYGFLNYVLSGSRTTHNINLKSLLLINEGTFIDFIYNLIISISFFVISLRYGSKIINYLKSGIIKNIFRGNLIVLILIFLFFFVMISILLGIAPIFGSLIAGMVLLREEGELLNNINIFKKFTMATFVPLYFIFVGLRLDLVSHFNWELFIKFFILSSILKITSVFTACIIQKISIKDSFLFGFSLNARGGPGIVLATISLNAGIINEIFFSTLVITAIITSQISGYYLQRNRERVVGF
ncbi:MAG: cation:proton antiporter, partial [Nanoarchaeota archaeon]|nr:cation:proton antiporter [Nanoarchaeota archaeon]